MARGQDHHAKGGHKNRKWGRTARKRASSALWRKEQNTLFAQINARLARTRSI